MGQFLLLLQLGTATCQQVRVIMELLLLLIHNHYGRRRGPKCRQHTGGGIKKLKASFPKPKLNDKQKDKSRGRPNQKKTKTKQQPKELQQSANKSKVQINEKKHKEQKTETYEETLEVTRVGHTG